MKVAFIHPLKHHIYHSMAGAIDSGIEVVGLFAYYDRNDIIDRIIKKTRWKKQIKGYHYEKIDGNVRTNYIIKILFLLSKINENIFGKLFKYIFYKWCVYSIKDVDCIHVLQDYENEVIRYAVKHNKKIIYEQILAYDFDQYICGVNGESIQLKKQKENLLMASHILMASEFVKESITGRIQNKDIIEKSHVIPYGADVEQFVYHKKHFFSGDPLKLLCVASISRRKGIDYLISAMEKLEDYPVLLTIVGIPDNKERDLLQRILECKNINYVGGVPHSEITNYYNNSHIFILPSLAEGSSLSVYEALASGLPCIVTANTGSVVEDGRDGYIIKTKDADSIVDAIMQFISDPSKVEKMSVETIQTISLYTWNNFESKICELYVSISEKGH